MTHHVLGGVWVLSLLMLGTGAQMANACGHGHWGGGGAGAGSFAVQSFGAPFAASAMYAAPTMYAAPSMYTAPMPFGAPAMYAASPFVQPFVLPMQSPTPAAATQSSSADDCELIRRLLQCLQNGTPVTPGTPDVPPADGTPTGPIEEPPTQNVGSIDRQRILGKLQRFASPTAPGRVDVVSRSKTLATLAAFANSPSKGGANRLSSTSHAAKWK